SFLTLFFFFFFFSSRRRHTRSLRDWSSDVCSSDLQNGAPAERFRLPDGTTFGIVSSTTAPFCRACDRSRLTADGTWFLCLYAERSEERRVGKECRCRWGGDD